MRGMTNTHSLILAGLLLATSGPAFADVAGIQAGTSGGVHGDVQIAKADYTPAQRQIGHQIGSGEPIYMGDQIATGAGGGLQVMLLDQTVMTLGQNAKMTVDEMVYDPKSGTGKLNFNVSQGAFRFVSGQIAKANPENVKITTPLATIGIRGTIVGGAVDGNNAIVALLGPGGETNTSARHGAIEVSTPSGTVNISRTGFATSITPGQPPSPPAPATPAQLQQFGQAGAGSSGTGAASTASTSSSSSSSSQQAASTTATQGTGSNPGDVTGNGQANGGTLSVGIQNVVTQIQVVSDIAKDTTPTDKKKFIDTKAAATSTAYSNGTQLSQVSNYLTMAPGTGLINAKISIECSGPCAMTSSNIVTPSDSGSAQIVDSTHVTYSFPNAGGYSGGNPQYDTAPLSLQSETSGVKSFSGNGGDANQLINAYDYQDVPSLTYATFGRYEVNSGSTKGLGVFAYGVETPILQMPSSGTATYSGSTTGYVSSSSTTYAYEGNAILNVDFARKTISGSLTNLTTTANTTIGTSAGTSIGSVSLGSASITGNSATGTASNSSTSGLLNGATFSTSSYSATFYGGNANEVAGTYSLKGSTYNVIGSYGAKK